MASSIPTKILIFGGTGIIGRYITSSILAAKPNFKQVFLFTSANTVSTKASLLSKWKSSGLSIIEGDITNPKDISDAFASTGADTVVSAVGRGVIDSQIELLRLAEESGSVKWFLPSEYGTDIEHNAKSPNEKPHQLKLKVRKFARENLKRVKVTYVVTGPYFDMWVDIAPGVEQAGGFDVQNKVAHVIDGGEGRVGFCTMWDVGKFVVATLRHPEQSYGKALKVQSFVVTPKQVVAEYEKQTGAKWTVSSTPLDDIRKLEAKLWEEGNPRATSVTLRRIWAEGGTLYEKNDNEVIGVKDGDADSLEVAVKRALAGGYKNETGF